jgi:hypothetical protein
MSAFAKEYEGVPLNMSRTNPECPDSADVLLRQEPDEEEDGEEEGDGKEDDDEDDGDEGYSE